MNVTDWKFPTVAEAPEIGGEGIWCDCNNIKADDGSFSYATTKNNTTNWLLGYTFDFSSIPEGATIDGIEVIIKKSEENPPAQCYVVDATVSLLYNRSAIGSNYASATYWPTSFAEFTYGGTTNLWGYALTREIVQHSSFGILLQAASGNCGANFNIAQVDYIKMRVHYTAGYALVEDKDKIISMGFIGDNPKISNVKVLKDTGWEQHAVKINKSSGWT